MDEITRGGHWLHNWVPLDAEALKEKFHGHVPAGAKAGMTHHATELPATPPGHIHVWDVQAGKMRLVTKAEAAAGHQRYGQQAFRPGSPARGEVEKRALALAREASGETHRAAGMLTNPSGTERLHQYWVHGPGAQKIQWEAPGSFDRCVTELGKYIRDPKGYCNLAHHAATGKWYAQHGHHAGRAAMADTKKPYGNVTYADPKNGKYPLDTEAHCRAAWSYINMPKNAAMYPLNGVTLSEVKDRIRAALKKYGADVSSDSSSGGASRSEILRFYPLDDIHIVSRADGDGTGRVVEAYAAVFDEPAEIKDHEGHYEETIDRSAFDQVLARIQRSRGGLSSAIRVLYNHGQTMRGQEAPEFQKPLGKPLDVRPDGRGLLTRTEYGKTPLAEEILEMIRSGSITAQSFVGGILRSDPQLKGPGDRYRARNGALTRVRRLGLGLREYGPVLYAAYPGAEFLGVRMGTPELASSFDPPGDDGFDSPEFEEYTPADEGDVTGGAPEDATSARYHQHELYALRSREQREAIGLTW